MDAKTDRSAEYIALILLRYLQIVSLDGLNAETKRNQCGGVSERWEQPRDRSKHFGLARMRCCLII